ncbi:Protein MODIFYING WALL LIGNIN-1, partial [Cucurbita argyrosperma subsp. sororia]
MEKRRFVYALSLSIVVSFALVAIVSCIAAELHRTKTKDLRLDGKLCYLPESQAFRYGVAALACLVIAQVIGNVLFCTSCSLNSRGKKSNDQQPPRRSNLAIILLVISWASFTVVILLLSAATSMSRQQQYGAGWLSGECYLVKSGVYIAAAILILVSTCSIVCSAVAVLRKSLQIDESRKTSTLPK